MTWMTAVLGYVLVGITLAEITRAMSGTTTGAASYAVMVVLWPICVAMALVSGVRRILGHA